MGLFKNEVGRPSNDTLKKRRIIATVMIFAVVLAIGACVFYVVNYFRGSSIEGANKNAKTYEQTGSKVAKSFKIENATGVSYKSSDKTLKIEFSYFNNTSAVIYIITEYNDDVTNGVRVGWSKYYYKSQIKLYDAKGMLIQTIKGSNITKTYRKEKATITTDVAKIEYIILDANKNRTPISKITTKVEAIVNNLAVTFPDKKLAKCVLSNYNTQNKTSLTDLNDSQLLRITTLDCTGKGITNVKGIEKLTNLKHLTMPNNTIYTSSLDLSKNTKLTNINLAHNNISKVTLKNNVSLNTLNLSFNPITKIDVSKNVNLTNLNMQGTSINSISLKKNVLLRSLDISNNKNFSSKYKLDLTKNTNLVELDVSGTNIEKANIKVASNVDINKILPAG